MKTENRSLFIEEIVNDSDETESLDGGNENSDIESKKNVIKGVKNNILEISDEVKKDNLENSDIEIKINMNDMNNNLFENSDEVKKDNLGNSDIEIKIEKDDLNNYLENSDEIKKDNLENSDIEIKIEKKDIEIKKVNLEDLDIELKSDGDSGSKSNLKRKRGKDFNEEKPIKKKGNFHPKIVLLQNLLYY